jgi:hypothetical protein
VLVGLAACSSASPPTGGGPGGAGGKAGAVGSGGRAGAGGAAGAGGGAGGLAAGTCGPGWVTFAFTGTVTGADSASSPIPVSIGQPMTGSFCFDPAGAAAMVESPNLKVDYAFTTDFALTVSAGGVKLSTDPDHLASIITVIDDGADDSIMVTGRELLLDGSTQRDAGRRIDLIASGTSASVFPDTSLPTAAFDPGTFAAALIDLQVTSDASIVANWDSLTRGP